MKKFCLFSALAAMVFTPYAPVHGNERAPYDPVVEICPGVPTKRSQMEKIAHRADFQKEACELYAQFKPSDKDYDMSETKGNFLWLHILTHSGKKGVIMTINFVLPDRFWPELPVVPQPEL